MLELPPALRSWRAALELFDDAVWEGLGDLLVPLQAAIGPMKVPRGAPAGEPDGLAGLSRRGAYDRLLLSEWAVALELPEEFVRRAVMGEHVFLAPAFVEPHTARVSVALLDCGPMQLGAPRLGQLAALIVLEQRARDARSEFHFGALQDDLCEVHPVGRASITSWLAARRWAPAACARVGWDERLRALAPYDLWFVGDPSLEGWARAAGAGLISFTEPLVVDCRALRARVARPGAPPREVELPLPPAAQRVRILRAPLAPKRRKKPRRKDRSIVDDALGQLSVDGRRLIVRRVDGGAMALHVPNTPSEAAGSSKQIHPRPGVTLVGVDVWLKRPVTLTIGGRRRLLVGGSGYGGRNSISDIYNTDLEAPPSLDLDAPARPDLAGFYVLKAARDDFEAWILSHDGELWCMTLGPGNPSLVIRERRCLALWRVAAGRLVWASGSAHRLLASSGELPDVELSSEQLAAIVPGWGDTPDLGFGYAQSPGEVTVTTAAGPRAVPYEDGEPYGIIPSYAGRPVLLLLAGDRRTLRASDSRVALHVASAPIVRVGFEPASRCTVWLAKDGSRGVYNHTRGAVVLELCPDIEEPG